MRLILTLLFFFAGPAFADRMSCSELLAQSRTGNWNDMLGSLVDIVGHSEPAGFSESDYALMGGEENFRYIAVNRATLLNQMAYGEIDIRLVKQFLAQANELSLFPAHYLTLRDIEPLLVSDDIRRMTENRVIDMMYGQLTRDLWALGIVRLVREQPFVMLGNEISIFQVVSLLFTAREGGSDGVRNLLNRLKLKKTRLLGLKISTAEAMVENDLKTQWDLAFGQEALERLRGLMSGPNYRPVWEASLQAVIFTGADFDKVVAFARSIGIDRDFRSQESGLKLD